MSQRRLLPFLLLFSAACTSDPEIQLTVVDVWNNPVAGATVIQEGVTENITVDANGKASVEVKPGQVRLLASAPEHTQDLQISEIAEDVDPKPMTFTLYPAPPNPGFFGVGEKEYDELELHKVDTVASEMSVYHGVKDTPKSMMPKATGKPHRFVFKTDLRKEEISRFNLKLSKLKFVESTMAKAVTGDIEVDLNLWVADTDYDYEVKGLTAEDVYLLTTEKPLPAGMYAFHAQNIMNATSAVELERLPEELRVVYPFEVK